MRRFTSLLGDALRGIVGAVQENDPERQLDQAARKYGVERKPASSAPELRVLLTHPGQTPAQLAECFGYTLVPTSAWEQRHMRTAQQMVDGGADPNRIGLFVVPGGAANDCSTGAQARTKGS